MRFLTRHESLLLIATVVMGLRLPSLFEPAWYGDENIYLTIGQGIRKGLVLYQGITDYPNKPPFIYLLAAAVKTVWGFRLVLMAWNAIHALVMWMFLGNLSNHKSWLRCGLTGLFILLTATPLVEGNIANGEIFMIMPTTAAMLLLWNSQFINYSTTSINKLHLFLAGIFFAVGFLFKIPVAADIIAAGLFFWLIPLLDNRRFAIFVRKAMWFSLGFAVPLSLILTIHAVWGIQPWELVQIMLSSTRYVGVWRAQVGVLAYLTFSSLVSRLVFACLLSIVLIGIRKMVSRPVLLASLWLVWALFGALLSARPYLHYLLQIVAPLVLLLWGSLAPIKKADLSLSLLMLVLVLLVWMRFGFRMGPLVSYYGNFLAYASSVISQEEFYRHFDSRMPRNYTVARYLRERTLNDERIYVWGTEPDIYVLADRLPVGHLTTSFHVEDLNEYQYQAELLRSSPPSYIIWMANEPKDFPELKRLLADFYTEEIRFDEAIVYRRMPVLLLVTPSLRQLSVKLR